MSIKVSYFGVPARGEAIRLLLAYGGEKFENDQLDFGRFQKLKPTLPFGQVPIYEENGRTIHQTAAIIRYLGKKYKLSGNDYWEDLEIDAIADTFIDFQQKILNWHYAGSASRKQKMKETLCNETIPYYLEKLNKIAKANDGHLAIKKLTWADFFFAAFIDYLSWMVDMNFLEKYPHLKAVQNNVFNLPAIKAWYEKNPVNKEIALQAIAFTGQCTED